MRKIFFAVSLAMALTACNNSTSNSSAESADSTATAVVDNNFDSVNEYGTVDSASLNVEILPAYQYPAGSPVAKWGKLKVDTMANGVRCLCDQNGNPVQLRGMSSHGMQWSGVANLTEANMRALRNTWNANIFRVAVYVDEEGGYAYNPTHRSRFVEDLVKWTAENGMYLLIDWHVLTPGNPMSRVYRNRPENGKDLAADFWTYCARRFQNQKHVIYEICNECNGVNYQNEKFGTSMKYEEPRITWLEHIKPYCEQMLKIIRSYDKDVVVICGTPNWDQRPQDVVGHEPVDENGKVYDNIMYTFHFYAASHNDGRHIETEVKFWDTNFMKMFAKGDGDVPCLLKTLPIFVTEWGTTDASGWKNFRPDLSDMWMDIFNGANDGGQMVSWCNWSFSAEGGACAALKWNDGNMEPFDKNILTESGKYIFDQLHKDGGMKKK